MKKTKQKQNFQEVKPVKLHDSEEMSENALLRQMKEEARKEKIAAFLLKYKKQLSILAISLVILVSTYAGYQSYQYVRNVKYSKMIHEALLNEKLGNQQESMQILEKISETKDTPNDLRVIASVKYASGLLKQGQKNKAVEVYLEASELKSDDFFRDLAALLAAKTTVDSVSDNLKDKDFFKRNHEIFAKLEKQSTFLKPFIQEQAAHLYFLEGEHKKSADILDKIIAEKSTPQFLKDRTQQQRDILRQYFNVK